jgi:hypothetical protein
LYPKPKFDSSQNAAENQVVLLFIIVILGSVIPDQQLCEIILSH